MTTQTMPNLDMRESIQRDLASFADPRTEVVVTAHDATWVQGKQNRRLLFLGSLGADHLPRVSYDSVEYDYAAFFASESMADLRGLAQEIPFSLQSSSNYVHGYFLPPQAAMAEDIDAEAEDGTQLLTRLATASPRQTRSSLIFLQGRAGDGKSSLLTHLAHAHAERYQRGETTWLYFYIDAQGRALARIDEAVAAILQDLRARFTYHGLSTLTRLGLLVPIIDGFDELLGSGGYEDAFASLESFVRRLHGSGALIASARSTFYKYSALGRAASRFSVAPGTVDIEVRPIYLRPWSDAEAGQYLDESGASSMLSASDPTSAATAARVRLGDAADEILSSPFLLTQFVNQLRANGDFEPGARFLRSVIHSLIRRELVDKIRDTFGNPILDEAGHIALLGALAEEMWWQESRVVDEDTFRTICELASEGLNLAAGGLRILLERLPSHAVLTRTERPVRISFRHEYYYAYFLGEYLSRAVVTGDNVDRLLTSSRVSLPIAAEFAASLDGNSASLKNVLATLSKTRSSIVAPELRAINAGALTAAVLRTYQAEVSGVVLSGMIFDAENLASTKLTGISFVATSFVRVDLRDIHWEQVEFREANFVLPILSDNSVLKGHGLRLPGDVVGIVLRRGSDRIEYDPEQIGAILVHAGHTIPEHPLPTYSAQQRRRIEQLNEFLRVVQRTLMFSNQDFLNKGRDMSEFRDVLRAAERTGVVDRSAREISGSRVLFRVRVDPEDLRAGESGTYRNELVRGFWLELLRVGDEQPPN